MTALLTENMPLLAGAPNGIKKLRELILELAVRGKLVPQDPNDEPASELLKRIAEEKARLVVEGKIRKAKTTAEDKAEISYEIPPTWAVASLGQVVEIVRGITFPASEKSKEPELGRIACLRTANVQDEIEWDDLLYIRESFVSRLDQYVEPHDIVMSMANSRELVGKVALIGAELKQKTTFGGFLGVLRPVIIEPRFVMALLRTPHARSALIGSASQTTNIANVSLGKLRPLPFAIPPLAEQHRIVAKVDELMALCERLEAQQADAESVHAQLVQALLDSLIQASDATDFAANWHRLAEHFHTLFITESSIDALKQTLLQLAVMGKLVPQVPSDEPASELLKRINEERSRIVEAGQLKKQKQLRHVTNNEQSFPPPNGWAWTRLGATIQSLNNGLYKPAGFYTDSGVISLRMYNIQDGTIVFSDIRRVNIDSDEIDQYRLLAGDLLINRVNSKDLVGKTAVIPEMNEPLVYESMNMRARPFVGFVDSLYLNLFMRTRLAKNTLLSHAKEAIGQASLNQGQISSLAIPLPPLAEQHRIVAKVDQLMALCDQLKARLTQARQLNEQLASTLVEQAVA